MFSSNVMAVFQHISKLTPEEVEELLQLMRSALSDSDWDVVFKNDVNRIKNSVLRERGLLPPIKPLKPLEDSSVQYTKSSPSPESRPSQQPDVPSKRTYYKGICTELCLVCANCIYDPAGWDEVQRRLTHCDIRECNNGSHFTHEDATTNGLCTKPLRPHPSGITWDVDSDPWR